MAISGTAFSPKEFQVLFKHQSEFGTSSAGTDMYQLDVDSVSTTSLNPNQSVEVRNSGSGRALKDEDFFQDRILTVKELTFSGNYHIDSGHKLLIHNILNNGTTNDNVTMDNSYSPATLYSGSTGLDSHHLFTVVIATPNGGTWKNLEFPDCVVTNFTLSADTETEGGRYKYSVTFAAGSKYTDTNDGTTRTPTASYSNTTCATLGGVDAGSVKVMNVDAILKSFALTIDNPAAFVGAGAAGYQTINRGSECSVTLDAQVKYDDVTDELISTFDSQTAATNGDGFKLVNSANLDITINDYVATNVSLSEGDLMMLDISLKAVDDGAEKVVEIDFTS